MKQIGAEKSSVAWFRLAECLKRKERERAFLLYRLLMHSFEDNAFLKKLEGDMWVDFDEQEAVACYIASAHHYKQRHEYYEAYLIYKKLSDIDSQSITYIDLLLGVLDFTPFLSDTSIYYAKKLSILCNKKLFSEADEFFQIQKMSFSPVQKNIFYQEFVINGILSEYSDKNRIEDYLKLSIEYLLSTHQTTLLQQFFTSIESLNYKWHHRAKELLETNK